MVTPGALMVGATPSPSIVRFVMWSMTCLNVYTLGNMFVIHMWTNGRNAMRSLKCHRNNWGALSFDTLCLTENFNVDAWPAKHPCDSGVLDMPENLYGFWDFSCSALACVEISNGILLCVFAMSEISSIRMSCAGFEIPKSFWVLFGLHAENGSGVSVSGRGPLNSTMWVHNGLGAKVSVEVAHCITGIHLIRIIFCLATNYFTENLLWEFIR